MDKYIATIILALATGLTLPAVAGTRDPGVNARQLHQHQRIANGVRSGELTRPEAKDLRSDQRDIRQEERGFKADGQLSSNERQELHQDQRAASQEIYQDKHDAQTRPGTP